MNTFRHILKFSTQQIRTFSRELPTLGGFVPKIIGKGDKENIVDFLKRHYYPYEPLNVCLNMTADTDAINEQSEFYLTRAIKDECSLYLLNQEDKIASVLLNKIETKGTFDNWTCKHPLVCHLSNFYNQIHLECMVAKKFDAETFINIEALAVDLNYIGKGLSQKMVTVTKQLAKKRNIKLITFICTSNYSAKSAMKAGFIEAFRMKFADYRDDGVQVFHPKLPHTEVQVFALSITG